MAFKNVNLSKGVTLWGSGKQDVTNLFQGMLRHRFWEMSRVIYWSIARLGSLSKLFPVAF